MSFEVKDSSESRTKVLEEIEARDKKLKIESTLFQEMIKSIVPTVDNEEESEDEEEKEKDKVSEKKENDLEREGDGEEEKTEKASANNANAASSGKRRKK